MTEGIHYSKELEYAVLAACLLEKSAIERTYGLIDEKVFYSEDNAKIYKVMHGMYEEGKPIDVVTVWEQMMAKEIKLNYGSEPNMIAYYVARVTNQLVSTAHLEYHCHLLKNMWRKRQLEFLTNSGTEAHDNVQKQISDIDNLLSDLKGNEFKQDWFDMSEIMYELHMHQKEISEGKKEFITTGFKAVDNLNGGFSGGNMIVIGARPSIGKSALVGKIALSIASKNKKVGVISLEMNNKEIAGRLASYESDISYQIIWRNLFEDENQQRRFHQAISNLATQFPIYVSDKTKVNIHEIRSKAMRLKHTKGCDCLILDYLQLIDTTGTGKNNSTREQDVSGISRGIKLMAMEMDIPVIAVCQLNRDIEKRSAANRYPKPSDLRESGSLEHDSDVIFMLHRDWASGYEANEDGSSTEKEADLFGAKWRNGSKFHLKLNFDPPTMKFTEQTALQTWKPIATSLPFSDD